MYNTIQSLRPRFALIPYFWKSMSAIPFLVFFHA